MHHRLVGDTSMTQGSVGFQAGGKAYSQIIFFEDKRALEEFQSGTFEFGAGASVTAVTASAGGAATTAGATANASAGIHDGTTATLGYNKGMAVFTIAKGGLMYAATIEGQKFPIGPGTPSKDAISSFERFVKGAFMENQVKGALQELGGKIQDAAGLATGDAASQAKGKLRQEAGQLQESYGQALDTVRRDDGR